MPFGKLAKLRNLDARIKAAEARKERWAAGVYSDDEQEIEDPLEKIYAFLDEIKQRENHVSARVLPTISKVCTCSPTAKYCNSLAGQQLWFSANFGCDYASAYHRLFQLGHEKDFAVFSLTKIGFK